MRNEWILVKAIPENHKWFRKRGSEGLWCADYSGIDPDETDDGPLRLDPTRSIEQYKGHFYIPVYSERRKDSVRTVGTHAEYQWVTDQPEWLDLRKPAKKAAATGPDPETERRDEMNDFKHTLTIHLTEKDKGLIKRLFAIARNGLSEPAEIVIDQDGRTTKDQIVIPPGPDTLCAKCGNPDVQVQVWMHANSGETYEDTGNYAWCPSCKETDTCDAEEWEKEKREIEQEALRKQVENDFNFGPGWVPCKAHRDCWHNEMTHEVMNETALRDQLERGKK